MTRVAHNNIDENYYKVRGENFYEKRAHSLGILFNPIHSGKYFCIKES